MKKKKGLVLGLLLIMAFTTGVVAVTYSRYISSSVGTADAKVATWKVSVNDTDVVKNSTFNFDSGYITWSNSDYIADGYIAPSRTGVAKLKIDATGSKVAVKYTIAINSAAIDSYSQINITKVNGQPVVGNSYTGTINLADVNKPVEIPIEISWTNADATNTSDTTVGSTVSSLSIPITVTAEQYIG